MRIFKSEKYIKNNLISASYKCVKGDTLYHGHEFLEIEFIVDGTGIYEIDGVGYTVKKNTVFVMTPTNIHALKSMDAKLVNVMFLRDSNDIRFDQYLYFEKSLIATFDDENGDFLKMLFLEIAKNSEIAPDYAMSLLQCVLFKLNKEKVVSDENKLTYINDAISYIQANFNKGITLDATATHLGLSSAYFSDLFHREMGTTFKEYLDDIRFAYVKRLLKFTELSVKEVCLKAGFYDYSNFARRFKNKYLLTPSEYRSSKRDYEGKSI